MESRIVVLGFEDRHAAAAALADFEKMQEEGLIEIEDAVVASRGEGSLVDIEQSRPLTGKYAGRGGGVGLLAGLLVGGPILGLALGASIGAITGKLKDHGLDDKFVQQTSEWVRPNTSAPFLLVKEAKADQVLERLKSLSAKVLTTTLPEEAEKRLKETLAAAD